MTEKNKNFLQKQENEGTREKMLDFQAVQAGYQKIEPGKEDAIELKLMSAQEQELSPEFMHIEECVYEFDCGQKLEPQPVQEQHRASESQSMQEEEHMANANQEQGESAQSSQNRSLEAEFGPVHEKSMLYAQEEKIDHKTDFLGILSLLVSVVVPFIAPVADKPDAYILYCVLLFAGYSICLGIAFFASSALSDSAQGDTKDITCKFVKTIAVTFFLMVCLASATYHFAYKKQIPPRLDETTEEETLALATFPNRTLAAGAYHSVFLRENKTVGAAGLKNDGRCEVSEWEDIVAVSAFSHTVGLKSDGTVVATGLNKDGQCDVSKWEGVVDIDANYRNTICVHENGTVSINGCNEYGQYDALVWTDIIQVEAGEQAVYGLKRNGTVVSAGSESSEQRNVSSWSNITAISSGKNHVVGLREDGTVVAIGDNSKGQCNVTEWTDIIAISAGNKHTVGLKSDGNVVSTGDDEYGQRELSDWKNVKAISAGMFHTIGINNEGEFLMAGSNANGQLYLP